MKKKIKRKLKKKEVVKALFIAIFFIPYIIYRTIDDFFEFILNFTVGISISLIALGITYSEYVLVSIGVICVSEIIVLHFLLEIENEI